MLSIFRQHLCPFWKIASKLCSSAKLKLWHCKLDIFPRSEKKRKKVRAFLHSVRVPCLPFVLMHCINHSVGTTKLQRSPPPPPPPPPPQKKKKKTEKENKTEGGTGRDSLPFLLACWEATKGRAEVGDVLAEKEGRQKTRILSR